MKVRLILLLMLLTVSASAAEREQIIFWHQWTANWAEVIDKICQRFNESQDRYEVKPLIISGGVANTKMLMGIVGGHPPDCMAQWSPIIAAWGRKGMLTPLESLMEEGEYDRLKAWLYPAVLQAGSYEGHLFALPTNFNTTALYCNVRLFREVGLDPDHLPRTTEELDAAAEKLYKLDAQGRIERLGFLPGSLLTWAPVFGGRWYDPVTRSVTATNPANVATLAWMQSYGRKFDVNRLAAFAMGESSTFQESWPFLTGRMAMVEDGQWRVQQIDEYGPKDFEYRVCPLPSPNGKRLACWSNANLMIIPRGAKNPRGAWEFIKFWNGWKDHDDGTQVARAAEFYTWGGWLPTAPAIAAAPAYQKYLKKYPAFRTFVEIAASPDVQVTPQFPAQQFFLDRVTAATESVMRLKTTPQAALEKLQAETDAELARVLAH